MRRTGRECEAAVLCADELVTRERGRVATITFADVNDPVESAREARRLVHRLGVDIVAGTVVTPDALAASEVTAAAGVPYAEFASAGQELAGEHRVVFRFALRGEAYGIGVVDFAVQRLAPLLDVPPAGLRLGIVHRDSAFGEAVASGVVRRAAALGVRIAHVRGADDGDPAAELAAELNDVSLDVLHLVHLGDRMAPLWRIAREAGAMVRSLVGHVGWGYRRTVAAAGALVDGTFVAGTPSLGTFETRALAGGALDDAAAWMDRCGDLGPAHNLEASVDRDLFFSGTLVLLRALGAAGARRGDDVTRILRALDVPLGATPLGYGVRFDARGENERAFLAVSQWRGDGRRTVWPAWIASDGPLLPPL